MLSDKINRLPISRADYPSTNSFDEQNTVISINKQGNILSFEHSRRNTGAAINVDRPDTSLNTGAVINVDRPDTSTGLHGKPIAYNLKSVTEDLERRRTELAAMARAAEAKAKEAEEKCEQAESILERELNQRLLAERRLRELEEGRLRQLQGEEIEGAQEHAAPAANGEMGAWLKEVEGRAKEAKIEIETLTLALMEAEQNRAKAETLAQAAGHKAREFESETRMALVEANRKVAEAEAAARAAEERAHMIESRYAVAEAATHQATERYQTLEAELQYEVKQRALAEQKLKEYEDELGAYLELDWSKDEPDLAMVSVARESGGPDELVSQLRAQIGAERRARQEAENARAAFELKIWEMDRALRIAEENNRQIASLNLMKSSDDDQIYTVKKQKGSKHELKFIVYGMAIALLVVALFALIAAVILQM